MFTGFRSTICGLLNGSMLALPIILALACTAEDLDRTVLDLELSDSADLSSNGALGDDPEEDAGEEADLVNSDDSSDHDQPGESGGDTTDDGSNDSDTVNPAEAPSDEGSDSLDPAGLPSGDESDQDGGDPVGDGADDSGAGGGAPAGGGGGGAPAGGGGGGGAPPADDGGGPVDGSSNGVDGTSNGIDDGTSNGLDEDTDVADGGGDPLDDANTTGNAYCEQVETWDASWAQFEQEVIDLVNERRSQGAVCGDVTFGPAGPLTLNTALRCAARNHVEDMALRDFFAHTNPDGDGPGQRIGFAGYDSQGWGENIAMGFPSPQSVIVGWMTSPGHCANIMKPSFTEIGVGYYSGNRWVQVFGTPR